MKDFQIEPQKQFRKRKVYSVGFILTETTIKWTGKWFKYIRIEEQLYFNRVKVFEEWGHSFYWSEWFPSWEFNKVI